MFEPIHGSAPKYEGKGVANPVASIESVRMMLDHLGEEKAALDIEKALTKVLSGGKLRTRDMGGKLSTSEMGDAVKEAILQAK
jgi:isocitrate/isopropylmalate dehydrogenase